MTTPTHPRYTESMDEQVFNAILGNVPGNLSADACSVLWSCAQSVPPGGAILDLNCGAGRSTVIMAKALNEVSQVIALDGHIRNIYSETPYQEGTALRFLTSLHRFQVIDKVIPVIADPQWATKILNKRCANLVVIQSPETRQVYNEDALKASIYIGQAALRKDGKIIVCCPSEPYLGQFETLLSQCFPTDKYSQVGDCPPLIRVYEVK